MCMNIPESGRSIGGVHQAIVAKKSDLALEISTALLLLLNG